MNDDTYDEDEEYYKDYHVALEAFEEIIANGKTPMEASGVILGMVANQFKRFGWTREDFVEFVETLKDTDWPDHTKPSLTLVKK